jgi:membrane fusion protein, multidrug efflux system
LSEIEKRHLGGWIVSCGLALGACGEATKPPPPPPATVYVAAVTRRDVPLYVEAVASLDGYVNAEIRARVRGFLRTQDYNDGAVVKAGQRLFTIEATDYVAAVSEAKAAVARARVAQARNVIQAERYQGLFKTGMVSQQDLDNVTASVADSDAQVQAAAAQLDQATLNLSYTQIRSPTDGVTGLALVRVGNLVGQEGPTLLTTVSQLDPIRVNFPVSELDYVKNPDRFKQLGTRDLAWAKKQFPRLDSGQTTEDGAPGIELALSDGSVYPHRGLIVALDRQIDPSTGTLQVQALVPNPNGALRPGQYGRVRIRRQQAGQNAIAIPEKALISVQGSYSVGVVDPDKKVHLRRVDVGPSAQGMRLIEKGLSEGEQIVVDGVQKITEGATVDPRPAPEEATSQGSGAPSGPAAASSSVKN